MRLGFRVTEVKSSQVRSVCYVTSRVHKTSQEKKLSEERTMITYEVCVQGYYGQARLESVKSPAECMRQPKSYQFVST